LLLHHPAIRRARQIVTEGLLGDPLYFKSTRESIGAPRTAGSAWWALAPHDVSLAIDLFGAVPSVVSATGGGLAGAAYDSIASATMRFAGGRTAHVHVARFASEATRRVSVAGSRRTLTFDELAADARLQLLESATGILTRVPVDDVDPLLAQCDHFLSLVRRRDAASGNAPDLGNGAHALAVVRVLEAAALSMRTGGTPIDVAADVAIATATATE
jgi:predicted dehydrogenase